MTQAHISQAVNLLHQGRLVAFPTETVYGLGADARNEEAVKRIFAAKNRPADHPLIVHLALLEQLPQWAREISPLALQLASVYWPGPLTMIFKRHASVLDVVTAGQDTVGIRIPRHPVAQSLLQSFGGGIAAPSANQFTHLSPTSAKDVAEELQDKVDLILDGGDCDVGVESTIIDMTRDTPVILRPGMITSEMISNTLGMKIEVYSRERAHADARAETHADAQAGVSAETRTPGMHHLHYAPTTKTMLIQIDQLAKNNFTEIVTAQLAHDAHKKIALLSHYQLPYPLPSFIHLIPMPQTALQYAHDLYHTLRAVDHQQFDAILIASVPNSGEWEAIQDRLQKASGGAIIK